MKTAKRTISAIAVILAIVLVGGWAFAHGPWGKRGYGYPGCDYGYYSNLSPEQREKLQAQNEKFYQDTTGLRRELYQKRLELEELWVDPKADPEKIKAKQREMFELQNQLREKALDHRMALRDLVPEEQFGRQPWGYGHGMGYGHHRGWGHMGRGPGFSARGGYGGGPCW